MSDYNFINQVIVEVLKESATMRQRFEDIVMDSSGTISINQLIDEFTEYLLEMSETSSDVLNENLSVHQNVFILTQGYPLKVNGRLVQLE